MPFDLPVRDAVDGYARADLDGDLDQHIAKFDFLADDPDLQQRVGEEYFTARYLYKLWEGLRVDETWANRAQVQLQVQQYASIYEACIHHVLFNECADEPVVRGLLEQQTCDIGACRPSCQNNSRASQLRTDGPSRQRLPR